MEVMIFFKGLIVGFIMCAPIGPIGVICVGRTLNHGRMAGLASLLGASTVDGLYCSVAGFGITYVAEFLKEHQVIFQLAGGLVLVVVGIAIIRSRPTEVVSRNDREGFFGNYTSAFFLTLMNPMSIIVFTAAFTGLGVHGWKGNYWSTAVLVLGVLSGSVV